MFAQPEDIVFVMKGGSNPGRCMNYVYFKCLKVNQSMCTLSLSHCDSEV